MSTPELLTRREQQLLAAIREVLDLPRAAPGHYAARTDALMERVPRLLGILDDLEHISAGGILRMIERTAARPLEYEPASREVSS